MASEKEPTKADVNAIVVARDANSDTASAENGINPEEEPRRPMATKRALIAWLVLCFSVRLECNMISWSSNLTMCRLGQHREWLFATFQPYFSLVPTFLDIYPVPTNLVRNEE
jgi:hypothetical protein